MSHHLIELSFGPVQGFIAAARRSRDLWAGSRLLSEVVRAAADAIDKYGGTLIYPTLGAVKQADGSNLSNVLLAQVSSADASVAARVVAAAQAAGRERLRVIAERERVAWERAAPGLRQSLWHQQIEGVVESYAAWAAWDGSPDGYRPAYDQLKTAFARRKNTRDFAPAPALDAADAGLPKSSLDGANESVLPKERSNALLRRMGLGEGEQLDAIGCVKRSFGRQESFTALTRLAADRWLTHLSQSQQNALNDAYEPLVGLGLATRSSGNAEAYKAFPYDGGLLIGEALAASLGEAKSLKNHEEYAALVALQQVLRDIGSRPNSYVALMCADGDRMGMFVDRARTPDDHTEISKAIAAFADKVPAIAREHRGHSIFNGGEDLMVAFPLANVVEGARALSAAFLAAVAPLVSRLGARDAGSGVAKPTLRAGVAICHVGEPMGYIRSSAEQAEKFAKGTAGVEGQGNALGLKLHGRGGHEIGLRLAFDDSEAFDALARWCGAYKDGQLPSRVAYDIRAIEDQRRNLSAGTPPKETRDALDAIVEAEFERVLMRARPGGGRDSLSKELSAALRARRTSVGSCGALGDELVLARWLSATTDKELGERE